MAQVAKALRRVKTKHQKANELWRFASDIGLKYGSGWSEFDGTQIVATIYDQFMRIQPSQRQALVKVLTTALMIRQTQADKLVTRDAEHTITLKFLRGGWNWWTITFTLIVMVTNSCWNMDADT